MHLTCGCANDNGLRAGLLCQETFPRQRHPNHRIFIAISGRLKGTGTFTPLAVNRESERSVRTRDVQERALGRVQKNVGVQTRKRKKATELMLRKWPHGVYRMRYSCCIHTISSKSTFSSLSNVQNERICVGGLFSIVTSSSFICRCSFQTRQVLVQTAS
jgi:hypothetical protein